MATNLSSPSDESKPITLRFPEGEIALYDVLAKTMGLTRQDFFQHLVRSCYKHAFTEFVRGYCESSPSVPLQDFMNTHVDSDELKYKVESMLYSIAVEIYRDDEQEAVDASNNYPYYSERSFLRENVKGIFSK